MNDTTTTKTPTIAATIEGNVLTLAFSNGRALVFNAADAAEALRQQAMMHGFKQKLVDAAAIARNPDTGRSATVTDKFLAVEDVAKRLLAGHWNKPAGEASSGAGTILVRALKVLYPTKDIVAYLADKTPEQKKALRGVPAVAAAIAALKPEPDSSGVDTEALLGELDD